MVEVILHGPGFAADHPAAREIETLGPGRTTEQGHMPDVGLCGLLEVHGGGRLDRQDFDLWSRETELDSVSDTERGRPVNRVVVQEGRCCSGSDGPARTRRPSPRSGHEPRTLSEKRRDRPRPHIRDSGRGGRRLRPSFACRRPSASRVDPDPNIHQHFSTTQRGRTPESEVALSLPVFGRNWTSEPTPWACVTLTGKPFLPAAWFFVKPTDIFSISILGCPFS